MVSNLGKKRIIPKVLLVSFIVLAVYFGNVVFFPHSMPTPNYQLVIDKDQSMSVLATHLKNDGVIQNRRAFIVVLRLLNKDKFVTAGLYNLNKPYSLWGLIRRITNGHPDQISVTILDGWTFVQLKQYVDGLDNVKHLSKEMSESAIAGVLKIKTPNLEGMFYPSTYFIAPNQTDFEIYQNAYRLMQRQLSALYESRSSNSHYTSPYQMLTMASLIQKETADIEDMYLVSTVFNNRLYKGMKLQDDPAVFYGLRHQNKVIRSDFQINTPYNTYLHYGLPPTPICIPSANALKAASNPAVESNLMFFVATGNGKTKFSKTYQEHVGAVNKYIKTR